MQSVLRTNRNKIKGYELIFLIHFSLDLFYVNDKWSGIEISIMLFNSQA